ncbi:bifunctional methylenetetrahydrofolate dehydrogenase/methenyltetrahydrofolate cyclohydrolase FolD [Acholeplasma vituli]|uniref:Bifunctional protein FolD n=1 Tax=Paracholeplasma vituli TaxID=69473 RepID=A0ABT2PWP7_9MOLU|nr:bifunctional methylenetetrahydrofolate dehydrogenase/methenyltetrahydrofolate cyclohydrolase FolD [Paracholeplasma vituli]MCU0104078.1 bifunctional methylenetetrahydrofolate dehydrogenase/methenyltetrahydrofolate cyclohydrolase FolD [Paracholeplasma vituli]
MILDGKGLAKQNEITLKNRVIELKKKFGITPSLRVILVGESPASIAYVNSKKKACDRVGIDGEIIRLPSDISEEVLIDKIESLNHDDAVDGILIQLPLPKHINETFVLNKVSPSKDVDGLHTINAGKLFTKQPGVVPATPLGVIMLLKHYQIPLEGKYAVVVGRSNLVGMPLAKLLNDADATVTVVHRKTEDITRFTKEADILCVAVGKPNFITKDMVKPGSVVVDVGINRVGESLVGDVDFEEIKDIASYITPVPGGVGPMTISALLFNVLFQYEVKYHD